MRGTPRCARFSASIKGHQPGPLTLSCLSPLPRRAGGFQPHPQLFREASLATSPGEVGAGAGS